MGFINFTHFLICFTFLIILIKNSSILFQILCVFSMFLILLRISEWLMAITRKYIFNPKVSSRKKAVFITGCDSGMGYMQAKRLDKLGYAIFAGCLYPEGDGAKALEKSTSSKLKIVPIDVTSEQSVKEALDFVTKHLGDNELWAVINNAGIGQAGEIEWTSIEEMHKPYEVNALGTARVIKAFIPLIRQSKGRIINNNSICAYLPCPGYAGYCMSKCASTAFTTALRVEMKKWGVKVSSVDAFFYKTPISERDLNIRIIEETWKKAPEEARQTYGEEYIEAFKKSCIRLLNKGSHHVSEVIDCFEDAVTSQEPLSRYFPCYFPHKVIFKMFFILPSIIAETYQTYQLPSVKPTALKNKYWKNEIRNGIISNCESNNKKEE